MKQSKDQKAEIVGIVIGCVLGSIDEDHVLVGPTAVAAGERGQGKGNHQLIGVH